MAIQLGFNCSESWNKMKTTDTGKFCSSCAKNVYDLTNKTEKEIHELYKENNGKLCGKIRSNQLAIPFKRKQHYGLAQFCVAVFFVFGSLLFNYELQAQNIQSSFRNYSGHIAPDSLVSPQTVAPKHKVGKVEVVEKLGEIAIVDTKVVKEAMYTIKGVVTDEETGEPLAFANVYFKHDTITYGAVTDFDGKYSIEVAAKNLVVDSISLTVQYIGYDKMIVEGIELVKNEVVEVNAQLNSGAVLMGVIIHEYHPIIDKDPENHGETIFDAEDIKRSPY